MNNVRHSGIFTIPDSASITVIGAGGLGATTALTLVKMGYKFITIYDGDVVSPENTGTQLHKPSDIGKSKDLALEETLHEFSDEVMVETYGERVDDTTELFGQIIVSAVDSINARKDIWNAVLQSGADWYIEMRMSAEELHIHTVDLNGDYAWYDKYILGQREEDIPELPCSMKATFFCAMGAAGFCGEIVRKIHTGVKPPRKLIMNFFSGTYMEI